MRSYGKYPAAKVTRKVDEELVSATEFVDARLLGKTEEDIQLSLNGLEVFSSLADDVTLDAANAKITFNDPQTGRLKGFIL